MERGRGSGGVGGRGPLGAGAGGRDAGGSRQVGERQRDERRNTHACNMAKSTLPSARNSRHIYHITENVALSRRPPRPQDPQTPG